MILGVMTVGLFGNLMLLFGPMLELEYFPPITDVKWVDIVRHDDELCWYMQFNKKRPAQLLASYWWIVRPDGNRRQALVKLNGFPDPVFPVEVGANVTIGEYCATLQRDREGQFFVDALAQESVVTNLLIYQSPYMWGTITYKTPSFAIPR